MGSVEKSFVSNGFGMGACSRGGGLLRTVSRTIGRGAFGGKGSESVMRKSAGGACCYGAKMLACL